VLGDVCRKESRLQREGGRRKLKKIDTSTPRDEKVGFGMRFGHRQAAPVGKRKVIEKEKIFNKLLFDF
jgi:hypothetical protein